MKPTILNIIFYALVKYILFYTFLMFKDNNYKLLEVSTLKNGEDWFYYLWLFLFMPILYMVILSLPLYYTFKIKNVFYFLILLGGIFVIEYIMYTYFASQANYMNGVINGIIGIALLLLFFYKAMPFRNY